MQTKKSKKGAVITKTRFVIQPGHLDAEWKGDYDLQLNDKVIGRSLYDIDESVNEVYECLSNEFKLSNNFRQKTKGRWLWDKRLN